MARPKKIDDAVAVQLVDELYAQSGDPKQLKFTALEAYAATIGVEVKSYDLRRNQAVVRRIAEIEALSLNPDTLSALAYKDLDIDGFIKTNKTPAKLKQALSELDGRWRKLYDYTISLFEQAHGSADKFRTADERINSLETDNASMSDKLREVIGSANSLKSENIYLRRMIREYLYPALADEVLQTPGADGSKISETAIAVMIDGDVPMSFAESVETDVQLRSREDILLDRLRRQAKE
ncbi:hypothetical protein FACS1894202_01100 [Clostridia bacterium]|nr:hypothetical protein FACS1894202_01100 [Clostridia bacterium]